MKVSIASISVAIAALAGFASATTYAQFCSDYDCSEDCGESVSTDNPGCLNESERHSIFFHGGNVQDVALVFSPSANCPCQNYCIDNLQDYPGCLVLNGTPGAYSFRFIGGSCGPNNCN